MSLPLLLAPLCRREHSRSLAGIRSLIEHNPAHRVYPLCLGQAVFIPTEPRFSPSQNSLHYGKYTMMRRRSLASVALVLGALNACKMPVPVGECLLAKITPHGVLVPARSVSGQSQGRG